MMSSLVLLQDIAEMCCVGAMLGRRGSMYAIKVREECHECSGMGDFMSGTECRRCKGVGSLWNRRGTYKSRSFAVDVMRMINVASCNKLVTYVDDDGYEVEGHKT